MSITESDTRCVTLPLNNRRTHKVLWVRLVHFFLTSFSQKLDFRRIWLWGESEYNMWGEFEYNRTYMRRKMNVSIGFGI
jgi:hypothetical protein